MMSRRIAALRLLGVLLGAMGAASSAASLEIQDLQTHYREGEYRLTMKARLDAPVDQVEAVIRDYANYAELDSRILEARVLSREAERVTLFTRLNACFGVFCRKIDRVEEVREQPYELDAATLPDRSDVKNGRTHTQLFAAGESTLVEYSTSITPKFWVPPLFGRSWMLRTLQDATAALFTNVETRAKKMASPDEAAP